MRHINQNTKRRNQQSAFRGIDLERLAAAGMIVIVVACGLMLSPTVRQSAAVFDKIDAPMSNVQPVQFSEITEDTLQENASGKSFSSRIIDRICRKFEFGIRLVGGTEISTILGNTNN